MLDTNMVSYIARGRSASARDHLENSQDSGPVYVSAITEGEILYGLAKRPDAHQVAHFMHAALAGLKVAQWDSKAAATYGLLRARNEKLGNAVGALDMLIAAHAVAENATLVTNDKAIAKLAGGPATVNWAEDIRPN
jgi:tRNA(fMet)-specific endonuclease VapC